MYNNMTAAITPVHPPIKKLLLPNAPDENTSLTITAKIALTPEPPIAPPQIHAFPLLWLDLFTKAARQLQLREPIILHVWVS
jgi:hypothetical protein